MRSCEVLEYLRKSRSDDPTMTVEEVLSRHEAILAKWTKDNLDGPIPADNIFREVVSGETIDARPQMQKLLKLIESPAIKAVLVVEVQRLSRGDLEDAGRIIKLFRYTNTKIITPMKTYDLSDEYDRDIFERELKRGNEYLEYTKKILNRGRSLSAEQGFFVTSEAPYGYDRVLVMDGKKKRYTLSPNADARIVKMIYDMYAHENLGMTKIANYLNSIGIKGAKETPWSKNTIRKVLTNQTYCGKIVWKRKQTVPIVHNGTVVKHRLLSDAPLIYEGRHPAIIEDALFDKVRSMLGRKPHYAVGMCINPLAGLLQCSCGYCMVYQSYSKARPRLMCSNYCGNSSVTFESVYNIVIDTLKSYIHDFDIKIQNNADGLLDAHKEQIRILEKRLEELDAIELAQWEKFSDPKTPMPEEIFEKLNEKVKKERSEVKEALDNAYHSIPEAIDYKERRITFSNCLDALLDTNASASDKNLLLKQCFQKIVYSRSSDMTRERNGKLINCGAMDLAFYLNI